MLNRFSIYTIRVWQNKIHKTFALYTYSNNRHRQSYTPFYYNPLVRKLKIGKSSTEIFSRNQKRAMGWIKIQIGVQAYTDDDDVTCILCMNCHRFTSDPLNESLILIKPKGSQKQDVANLSPCSRDFTMLFHSSGWQKHRHLGARFAAC